MKTKTTTRTDSVSDSDKNTGILPRAKSASYVSRAEFDKVRTSVDKILSLLETPPQQNGSPASPISPAQTANPAAIVPAAPQTGGGALDKLTALQPLLTLAKELEGGGQPAGGLTETVLLMMVKNMMDLQSTLNRVALERLTAK